MKHKTHIFANMQYCRKYYIAHDRCHFYHLRFLFKYKNIGGLSKLFNLIYW
jgi:hypothetical protein